jgi:nicotinamide-nucleotide amidase
MKALLPLAEKIAASLIARKQTIAIAESSTGGLVAATLLAVPGASAYFLGGAVVYTKSARAALLGIGDAEMQGLRPATEDYSLLIARRVRERHGATWGFGETGATGPSGNRYGDPADTPAWRSPVRQSGRLRCARVIPTDWQIWMRLRRVHSNFLSK